MIAKSKYILKSQFMLFQRYTSVIYYSICHLRYGSTIVKIYVKVIDKFSADKVTSTSSDKRELLRRAERC